LLDFEVSQHK